MSIIARALAAAAPELVPTPPPKPRRSLRPAPLSLTTDTPISLDAVPGLIDAAVSAYLADPAPNRALLLALPAGAGKTTALVQVAERIAGAGQRVMYCGPRHDFFADILAISERPGWWYEWQPRRLGSETQDPTCRWAPQITGWMQRGYRAIEFCKNPRVCGFDYLTHDCPFHAQQRVTHPIIFAQHAHVALRHPLMPQCSLLIGDESPLSAFLSPWIIPPGSVVLRDQPPEIEQLLYTLQMLCHEPVHRADDGTLATWDGAMLLEQLGGAEYIAELCERYRILDAPAAPNLRAPEDIESIDYCYLPALLSLLQQESGAAIAGADDWVRRVRCTPEGVMLLMRRRPGPLPSHIIWCDATGDAAMYERLLGMPVEVVRPTIAMAGTIYQVHAALNNSSTLLLPEEQNVTRDRRKAVSAKRESIQSQVVQIIARGNYQRPAIISYKRLTPDLAAFGEVGHFGGERGTNRFEQCDALIVIGTPQPPTPSLIDAAAMLFDERMRAFNAVWSEREIPYHGQPYAWPIGGYWDDAELQIVVSQSRDAELIQAINRARPLRRAVDVWLLTNAPLAGVPVELVSLRQLYDAPDGIDPARWPALRDWARLELDDRGVITTAAIAAQMGVQAAAARRYLEFLIDQEGYERCKAPTQGRGRPPLAAQRKV